MGKSEKKGPKGQLPQDTDEIYALFRSKENESFVLGEKQAGSHRTLTVKPKKGDGKPEPVTLVMGKRRLLDTNPTVYFKLKKQLKRLGYIAVAGGLLGIAIEGARRIATGAVEFGSPRPSVQGGQENLG